MLFVSLLGKQSIETYQALKERNNLRTYVEKDTQTSKAAIRRPNMATLVVDNESMKGMETLGFKKKSVGEYWSIEPTEEHKALYRKWLNHPGPCVAVPIYSFGFYSQKKRF